MVSSQKKLVILTSLFVFLIIITLLVNQWATKEVKQLTNDVPAPAPEHISPVKATPSTPLKPSAAGRPVVIDPANDPLAPVVQKPRKQPKPSANTERPPRVYETPMNQVIMVQ